MARPVTRTKNSSQRPGQILLDMKQKRRTSEQKQLDDADAQREREEAAAARERGIKRLANIISQTQNEEDDLLPTLINQAPSCARQPSPPLNS
ncbi:hypothetical protein JVT61DRAFT_10579 [Boletus reticuloceps]|uniref:Uncharacterized protein n=1 Tax=Boletus reticuloceps TaxID=495285 RepID=A0A8I3AC82_9AGAM|nr:hypothetical protein JVT61DRAFT_10579 [Boletus reticuloceps]